MTDFHGSCEGKRLASHFGVIVRWVCRCLEVEYCGFGHWVGRFLDYASKLPPQMTRQLKPGSPCCSHGDWRQGLSFEHLEGTRTLGLLNSTKRKTHRIIEMNILWRRGREFRAEFWLSDRQQQFCISFGECGCPLMSPCTESCDESHSPLCRAGFVVCFRALTKEGFLFALSLCEVAHLKWCGDDFSKSSKHRAQYFFFFSFKAAVLIVCLLFHGIWRRWRSHHRFLSSS